MSFPFFLSKLMIAAFTNLYFKFAYLHVLKKVGVCQNLLAALIKIYAFELAGVKKF